MYSVAGTPNKGVGGGGGLQPPWILEVGGLNTYQTAWFWKNFSLTLYDPGGGGFKRATPPIFCTHAFNFGATLLCVDDFSKKIV